MKIIGILIGAYYLVMVISTIAEAFKTKKEEDDINWVIGTIIGAVIWPILMPINLLVKLLKKK